MYDVTLEYEDGYVETREQTLLSFRGVKHNGNRPVYVTVTHKGSPGPVGGLAVEYLNSVLKGGAMSMGRIRFKPYWFHCAVSKVVSCS